MPREVTSHALPARDAHPRRGLAMLVGRFGRRLRAGRGLLGAQVGEDPKGTPPDLANEAILTIDVNSVILAASPATAELFGYPVEQLIGRRITSLMPPLSRMRHVDAFAKYLRTGQRTIPWHGAEFMALHASGREFPIEVSIREYGTGTGRQFTGVIPDISQRMTRISVDADHPVPAPIPRPGHETILVAEDEAVVRDMVVAALERSGYRVVAASTGEEAVRLIDRMGEEIDLLLSDVVMPGMSGPDLYDRARRTRPDLKAIFMTGYTALSIGRPIPNGTTLLEKPFSGARLSDVVHETLAAG